MASEVATIDQVLHISQQLSLADQLQLINLLSERVHRELVSDGEPVDMLSLVGVGAELWREINVDAYLEQERATWGR